MICDERNEQYKVLAESTINVGISWDNELTLMNELKALPNIMPKIDDVVNCETDFPEMSPTLLHLANLKLIWARDAEANKKHIFLPAFAVDAKNRNKWGNASAMTSM